MIYGIEHTLYGDENTAVRNAKENILALQQMTSSLVFEPHMILKNPSNVLSIEKLKTLVSYIKSHKADSRLYILSESAKAILNMSADMTVIPSPIFQIRMYTIRFTMI